MTAWTPAESQDLDNQEICNVEFAQMMGRPLSSVGMKALSTGRGLRRKGKPFSEKETNYLYSTLKRKGCGYIAAMYLSRSYHAVSQQLSVIRDQYPELKDSKFRMKTNKALIDKYNLEINPSSDGPPLIFKRKRKEKQIIQEELIPVSDKPTTAEIQTALSNYETIASKTPSISLPEEKLVEFRMPKSIWKQLKILEILLERSEEKLMQEAVIMLLARHSIKERLSAQQEV